MANTGFWHAIRSDLAAFARREGVDLSFSVALRLVLLSAGFQFVLHRRIGEALPAIPLAGRPLRRVWFWWTCRRFASEIAIGAEIGPGLYIPHPYGIVIGVGRVGRDVTILQNVTIGARDATTPASWSIGDGAYLGAGAVILGEPAIGAGAVVGANSVVLADVPAGALAVGAPARLRRTGTQPSPLPKGAQP